MFPYFHYLCLSQVLSMLAVSWLLEIISSFRLASIFCHLLFYIKDFNCDSCSTQTYCKLENTASTVGETSNKRKYSSINIWE